LIGHRVSPAAEARTRFDEEAADRCSAKPLGGCDTGRAAADNDDFNITVRHYTSIRALWSDTRT
jgi:hypothetical protein